MKNYKYSRRTIVGIALVGFLLHLFIGVKNSNQVWVDAAGGWISICGLILAASAYYYSRKGKKKLRDANVASGFFRNMDLIDTDDLVKEVKQNEVNDFWFGLLMAVAGTAISSYGPLLFQFIT